METTTKRLEPGRSGYADVNGLHMYYELYGQGSPLVLLHGGMLTIDLNFATLIPALAREHQLIGVEMQGHGRTADTGREITPAALASDVVGLLDQLGIDRAHVFGHSMGGAVALELGVNHPGRVRSARPVQPGPRSTRRRSTRRPAHPRPRSRARSASTWEPIVSRPACRSVGTSVEQELIAGRQRLLARVGVGGPGRAGRACQLGPEVRLGCGPGDQPEQPAAGEPGGGQPGGQAAGLQQAGPQHLVVGLRRLGRRPEHPGAHRPRARSMVRRCSTTPNQSATCPASTAPDAAGADRMNSAISGRSLTGPRRPRRSSSSPAIPACSKLEATR